MSGLLNYLMSAADTSKRKLRSLFDDPIGNLQMSADDNIKAFTGSVQNKLKPTQQSNLTWGQPELNPADYLAGGVGKIVWHGSPHKFDKFDMSKIGTGEGAQAYGHGLYMAESPDVAKSYKALEKTRPEVNGKPFDDGINSLDISDKAKGVLRYELFNGDTGRIGHFARQGVPEYVEAEKALKLVKHNQGALYKVDIPDEAVARFLDWDKKLSEQAPEVQKALNNMFSINRNKVLAPDMAGNEPMGNLIYNRLQELMSGGKKSDAFSNSAAYGQDLATRELKDLGVQGIRYLDGGSRGLGEGTSNYVLFDDQLARILERNGQSTGLNPWNLGEWRGLLDE